VALCPPGREWRERVETVLGPAGLLRRKLPKRSRRAWYQDRRHGQAGEELKGGRGVLAKALEGNREPYVGGVLNTAKNYSERTGQG